MKAWLLGACSVFALVCARSVTAQDSTRTHARSTDSVTIRIVGVELRSAVEVMQQYLDRPVIFTGTGAGPQVSLETPRPIPRADVPRLLRGLLEAQGYELVADSASGTYRARLRQSANAGRVAEPPAATRTPASAVASHSGAPELFVIPLKHARAADAANSINTLFGHSATGAGSGAGPAPSRTLSDELRANQIPPVDAPVLSTALPVAPPATRSATLTGDVTIVPDARANSLLIRANRADFELIQSAVQQIDVRPPQVLIEVMIVEARRDRSFSLGVDASVAQQKVAHTENTTIGGSFTPGNAGLGDFSLKVMGISGIDVDATISAAVGRGDVKILSRPVVLTANDEQAEVVVGSQRPFVQVSRALPTEDAVRDQVVQYKDVGTKLTVRPTISIDGTVQLNVTQEVSNATTETAFNAPVISTRSIRTDLFAQDGQTIVLGGLTDREHQVQSEGIPILSSIPLLGGFFGRQSRSATETELFVFLTPHVVRSNADAERVTAPMRERAQKVKP